MLVLVTQRKHESFAFVPLLLSLTTDEYVLVLVEFIQDSDVWDLSF
jgi:hypothetical protein